MRYVPISNFLINHNSYDVSPISAYLDEEEVQLPKYKRHDRFREFMLVQQPLLTCNQFKQMFNLDRRDTVKLVMKKKEQYRPIQNGYLPHKTTSKPTLVLDLDATILFSTAYPQTNIDMTNTFEPQMF